MKKLKLYAIFVVAMAIIISALVVSCKKETTNALIGNKNESVQSFNPREIEDMNAYLKDFKQKMQSATKGEDEALSIEDAAWHLASVANYELANASVEFDIVRFDTIDLQVTVTGSVILLSDLYKAYGLMCPEIQKFQNSLNLDNQNLRFINVSISDDGRARVALMTTYNTATKDLDDHFWYFDPLANMDSICDHYFSNDSTYTWNGTAINELTRILNLFESCQNGPEISYYTPAESVTFEYNWVDWFDPYGSPFHRNSRICAIYDYPYHVLTLDEMCYCLDSYLGLGYDYLENASPSKRPVGWRVTATSQWFSQYHDRSETYYHQMTVQYGNYHSDTPTPSDD